MSWARFDDSTPGHPKIVGLSDTAFRIHFNAVCYCAQHLTDGFISTPAIDHRATPQMLAELVSAGLWITEKGGYRIHDFLDYNRSRSDVQAERTAAKERQAKARKRREQQDTASRCDSAVSHTYPDPTRSLSTSDVLSEGGSLSAEKPPHPSMKGSTLTLPACMNAKHPGRDTTIAEELWAVVRQHFPLGWDMRQANLAAFCTAVADGCRAFPDCAERFGYDCGCHLNERIERLAGRPNVMYRAFRDDRLEVRDRIQKERRLHASP